MSTSSNKDTVLEVQQYVEEIKSELIVYSDNVWNLAELSLEEEKSSALLIEELKKQDLTIDSVGTSNTPTAFVTRYGTGSPVIGVMTEYDALPGLGNDTIPEKTPPKDGSTNGHGCGHNLIGAEGLWGKQVDKDGADGTHFRTQITTKFTF